jgi:hypothetical protein
MIVLKKCNSSPVCCNRYLLIIFLFGSCRILDGYRYIDAPYFLYVDEDCYMKSTMIASIGSPLLFVCGATHVKNIS